MSKKYQGPRNTMVSFKQGAAVVSLVALFIAVAWAWVKVRGNG